MKKAIFLGLFFGLGMLFVGFWLGFRASTPEAEVSIAIEEAPQTQSERPTRGVTPRLAQIPRPIFAQQEEEEPQEPKTEVVQSEVEKKLAKLGLSLNQKFSVNSK